MIPQPAHPWIPYSEMNDEHQRKAAFVTERMLPMLACATRGMVTDMQYRTNVESDWEIVWVELNGQDGPKVNVTGDSEWAICKDVLKALAEKYE